MAACTESQLRITMLMKRTNPVSLIVICQLPICIDARGSPGRVNIIVKAANTNGNTMRERFKVKPRETLENR
jgi:hypothetical protein